jgi:hypothetical protein
MALQDTLGINIGSIKTPEQAFAKQAELVPKRSEAAGEALRAETAMQNELVGAKAKAAEEVYQGISEKKKDLTQKELEFPYPEFHPTEDNVGNLAGLFSLVATMGVALGSSGKLSALNSMNAMGGMLKGWQAGRKDLFEKEKKVYDENMARIKQIRDDLRKDFDDYYKLAPYQKDAAALKLEEIIRKAGSDSIIATKVKQMDIEGGIQILDGVEKMLAHKEDMYLKHQQLKAGLKPGQTTQQHFLDTKMLRDDMAMLQEKLKDPELRKKLDEYRAQNWFGEQSTALEQILQKKIPADVREFATLVKVIRNKTYLDMSGKAVTGGEALRNFGAVIQPSDSAAGMDTKLKIGIERADRNMNSIQEYYPGYFGTPTARTSVAQAASSDTNMVATKAEVKYAADTYNITEEEAKKRLRDKGYKIEGE